MADAVLLKPSETEDGFAHLRQDRDSWYIRFYLWTYRANENKINTCKLWWAFIFAFIFAPLRLIGVTFMKLTEPLATRINLGERFEEWEKRQDEKNKGKDSKFERAIEAIGNFFTKIGPVLEKLFFGVCILWVGFIAVVIVIEFIQHPVNSLAVTGGIAIAAAIICGLVWYIEEHHNNVFSRFWNLLKALAKGFHRRTCAKIDLI